MNSKTFCILPWAHTRITTDGTLTPCCKISHDFPVKNITAINDFEQDWWNDLPMKKLRQDLLQGHKSSACAVCWADEAAGKSSLRQEYNKRLSPHIDLKSIAKTQSYIMSSLPIGLELEMGNICNFKCMMCGPKFSSKIQSERTQHQIEFKKLQFLQHNTDYHFDWPNQERFQKFFAAVAPELKVLQLKGGEPLLIKNAMQTIKSVKDKANTVISITTNGSVEFDDDFVEQLEQFEHCWLFVSVDGIEDHAEYIRYGSNWRTTANTILKLSQLKNTTFKLSTVLQFYSSLTFPRIADYALKHDLDIELLFCYSPKFLGIDSMLPSHYQKFSTVVDDMVAQYPNTHWLSTVQGHLRSYMHDSQLHQQCKHYTMTLDQIRKNSLPEIQRLFEDV